MSLKRMSKMNYRIDDVIKIAEAEVGYLEKSKSAYKSNPNVLYDKTAGAGSDNYTKYGKEMHDIYPAVMDFPASWCDSFCDWCFQKAYGVSNAKGLVGGNFDDYTPNSAQLYKNKKAYIKRGEAMPKRGDQIFFNNGTRIYHTGIVYAVDANKVYTIEGNTSAGIAVIPNGGGVYKKSYSLTNSRIDGYGRPNYGEQIDYSMVFEAPYYSEKYADLKKAFGAEEKKLLDHFVEYGVKEGRRGNVLFDPAYYRNKYADLRKAYGEDFKAYYEHFISHGVKEGRQGSEDFNPAVYKERYTDLRRAFGNDWTKYYEHYMKYGRIEGRKGN